MTALTSATPSRLSSFLPILAAIVVGFTVSGLVAYAVGQSPLVMLIPLFEIFRTHTAIGGDEGRRPHATQGRLDFVHGRHTLAEL